MMNLPCTRLPFSWFVYGEMHHGDVTILLNKNAGLQVGDYTYGAQNELNPDTF
jgi:hypothetical protein